MARFLPVLVAALLSSVSSAPIVGRRSSVPSGPARTYELCQLNSPLALLACPEGTIYVSKTSKYKTIQSAIESLPQDTSSHTILIAPGNYTEQLNVTRPGPLTLLGVSDDPFLGVSYADVDSDTQHKNLVTVYWAAADADSTGTVEDDAVTAVLTVAPTYDS
jgi:pectin methylesterase-like acyl-CoA thioesterase